MILKNYQTKALRWLRDYYKRCRVLAEMGDGFPTATAFTSTTAQIFEGVGLPYADVPQVPGIPYVCIRIPTGGGKTLLGCEALDVARTELVRQDHIVVIWLVPSDPIREQTLGRLRDENDPYRKSVAEKLGRVEVFDIQDALTVKKSVLESSSVIIVATIQAFRREDTSVLQVFKDNGELMSHFENLPTELLGILEREPEGHFHHSLVNVLRLRRPFVVVDEAHNVRQPLSLETLKRINPIGVLELTATPNTKKEVVEWEGEEVENPPSNILYSVSAYALKAEEMIKLPIYLNYREPWDALLGDAIGLLDQLQKEAEHETRLTSKYLRPIMLLQAQPEYKDRHNITVAVVEKVLLETFHIPKEQIAVVYNDRRELDKVAILSRDCPIRFVITVAALKEGWDCPFAYVLFSVAELAGQRGVEQILGRVLRMPYAERKKRDALNNAYAFVASTRFSEAAKSITEGLIKSGFEKQDIGSLVVNGGELNLENTTAPVTTPITIPLAAKPTTELPMSVIGSVTWDEAKASLTIEKPLTPSQEAELVAFIPDLETKQNVAVASARKAGRPVVGLAKGRKTPAQAGEDFTIPLLSLKFGEEIHAFEDDDIVEAMQWSLSEADPTVPSFMVPEDGRGIIIDISDSEKLKQDFIARSDRQLKLLESTNAWSVGVLVHWLDRSFAHTDLTEAETGIFLTRVIAGLVDSKKFTLEQLTAHRYRLAKSVEERVKQLRVEARTKTFNELLFTDASKAVFVSLASSFTFDKVKYPANPRHVGLGFEKHYHDIVGHLANGEEEGCARIIDSLKDVAYWIRNIEREPTSFSLQTSTDKFYPDFVAKLTNGKLFAIEYKGGRDAKSPDTMEKERLGDLWAARSNGQCLFAMIRTPSDYARIPEIVKAAMAS